MQGRQPMEKPRSIVNEIEKKHKQKKHDEAKELFVPKTATDVQKLQVERLMKDPDKLVEIPDAKKTWKPRTAPEFVRHVMGSSAGAGSGEFHVYRGIRRREMNRVQYVEKQAEKERLDEEYHEKLEINRAAADAKTSKKRAKRQKRKQKKLLTKKAKEDPSRSSDNISKGNSNEESEESESAEEEDPHFVIGGK